jgi:hypothetical protein
MADRLPHVAVRAEGVWLDGVKVRGLVTYALRSRGPDAGDLVAVELSLLCYMEPLKVGPDA